MKFGLRELATLGIVVAILVGSYMVGFKPLGEQRRFLEQDTQAKLETLQHLQLTNATVTNIEGQLDELSGTIKRFEARLPRQKDVQDILGEFTRLAQDHALTVVSVKPLKSESTPGGNEQPIEVQFRGSYIGFHGFLVQLERLDRITRIKQMSLKKLDTVDEMEAKVTLSIFFAPDAPATTVRPTQTATAQ